MSNHLRNNNNTTFNGIIHTIVFILIMVCFSPMMALANSNVGPTITPTSEPANEQQQLARHIQSLNELTERRRTNRLFTNEQTPLHGQRIQYTNVGKGNTTFIMRDMALINRLPIVLARVYDSSDDNIGDFGLGWRLNYAQSISVQDNGDLIYSDESGSKHHITKQSNDNGTPNYYANYHFAQINTINQTSATQFVLTFNNGFEKVFTLMAGQFKLSQINDSFGNSVDLRYENGLLKTISSTIAPTSSKAKGNVKHNTTNQYITISRNNHGLISAINDHHNRQIKFTYQNHLLKTSQDLAGNLWRYHYKHQQLSKIIDPEYNQVAKFSYYQNGDNQGKTKTAKIGNQTVNFAYAANITTATNTGSNQQQITHFTQHQQGVTVAVTDSQGKQSRISLNNKLQVVGLFENDQIQAQLLYNKQIYNKHNNPSTIIKNGQSYALNYVNNQLVSIGDAIATLNNQGQPLSLMANGTNRQYTYNNKGDVIEQRETLNNGTTIVSLYQYNDRGLLTSLTANGDQATFDYDAKGQLSQITFPDGQHHSYQYNALGFRTKTIRSDGSSINYRYDNTGNLLSLDQLEANGNSRQKEMRLDENNLTTEYIVDGKMMLDIAYDDSNNPVRIAYNGKPVTYQYDAYNRLTTIIDGDKQLNYNYQQGESDLRIQQDERSFISRLSKGKSRHDSLNINHLYTRTVGTPHRYVYFDPNLNQFKLPSFEQIIATDINHDASQRRRLYNATAKNKKTQRQFDKPSSSIFTPVIYSAINCEADFCWELVEVFLDGPSSAIVGQSVSFSATPIMGNLDEFGVCNIQHRLSIDGQIIAYNGSGLFNYTFGSPGTKNVQVRSNCQNCATWNFQYDSYSLQSIGLPKVTILSADVTKDEIKVKLEPQNVSGRVTLFLVKNNDEKIELEYRDTLAGTYHFKFYIDSLDDNTIIKDVYAQWKVGTTTATDTLPHAFLVLGNYRHSQYNTPKQNEATCDVGSDTDIYLTQDNISNISSCFLQTSLWETTVFKDKFAFQVELNGSGILSNNKPVQRDEFCPTQSNAPIDANASNTRRIVNQLATGCGSGFALNNASVAVRPIHGSLTCGDKIFIKGHGIKTVTDYCPICTEDQLDNYTTANQGCDIATDLTPSAKTIKLLD